MSLTPPSMDPFDFSIRSLVRKNRRDYKLVEKRSHYYLEIKLKGCIQDDIHLHFRHKALNINVLNCRPHIHSPQLKNVDFSQRCIFRKIPIAKAIITCEIRYVYEENVLKVWLPKQSHDDKWYAFKNKLRVLLYREGTKS